MLFLLYIMVFVLEVLLVYVGGSLGVEHILLLNSIDWNYRIIIVQPRLEGSWFGRCLLRDSLGTCQKSSSMLR